MAPNVALLVSLIIFSELSSGYSLLKSLALYRKRSVTHYHLPLYSICYNIEIILLIGVFVK